MEYCSFCNKSADEVPTLLAGSNAYICSDCVTIAHQVLIDNGIIKQFKQFKSFSHAQRIKKEVIG